jgi:membrane protease YdiL (CAAX protease family)
MVWTDHLLVVGFAALWPAWGLWRYPEYRRRVRAGVPGTRLAAYAAGILAQWLLAAAAVALWAYEGRAWSDVGLVFPSGGGAWLGSAVAAILTALIVAQNVGVARRRDLHGAVREVLAPYDELLPADRNDLTGWLSLSATAGVCEEILFRGVLPWYLAGIGLGHWGGHAAALLVFGAAHLYLGPRAAVRALVAGGAAAGFYLWTGSLAASMVLHASVDAASGTLALAVRPEPPKAPAAGEPSAQPS